MKINLRSITVLLGLLAIASILVPTQTQIFASTDTEPRQLDIEEAGDDDNNAVMLLMTTKEGNNKPQKVQGFRLGPDNVIFVEVGKNVQVTDDENFFRSIVTDTKDNDKQIPISQQGVVNLRGVKQGPYTLDVVIQEGNNKKIAYEVVLYIGPDNDNNRNTVNKEVERVNKDVTINKKIVKIEKNVTECGKGTKFSERTGKCEIVKPPTDKPTPPTPAKPTTPGSAGGQKPTTGITDGKAPPSCTTPDGKPGGISLSDGNLQCIPLDSARAGTAPPTPTKTPTPPTPTKPGPDAFQKLPDGTTVFPPGTQKVACPQFSGGQCVKLPTGAVVPVEGLVDLPGGGLGQQPAPSLTGPGGPLDPNNPVGKLPLSPGTPGLPQGGPGTPPETPPAGAGTPSGNAFPPGTKLTRMPDGGLLVAPPNAQAIYLKPTASGMYMPSQNPDGSVNIASPLGFQVKPGSITTGPEGVDLSKGVPITTMPKATTTGPAPEPETPTEPGPGIAGRTAVGGAAPDTTTPPAGGTAVRPPETEPEEVPPTPIPEPAPSGPDDGGATTEPIPDPSEAKFCENPANQDLPQCQTTDPGSVVSGPGPGEPDTTTPIPDPDTTDPPIPEPNICDTDPTAPECQEPIPDPETPIPDPEPQEDPFGTDTATTAPPEEDTLFGGPLEGAQGDQDGGDDAARTLEGSQSDQEDPELAPPTPDTTTEGGMEDTDVPPLVPEPPTEEVPAPPVDPVDPCLADPTLPDCNPVDPPAPEEIEPDVPMPQEELAPVPEEFVPQEEEFEPAPEDFSAETESESENTGGSDEGDAGEGGDDGDGGDSGDGGEGGGN